MSQPMTWERAACVLKWDGRHRGRRLKRLVLAREKQTGKRIAIRLGGEQRTVYRVTMSALRKHCRDLFKSKVDEVADNFKAYFKDLDERIASGVAEHVEEYVEPRLEELWQRDEKIAEQVSELGRRVAHIAGASIGRPRKTG